MPDTQRQSKILAAVQKISAAVQSDSTLSQIDQETVSLAAEGLLVMGATNIINDTIQKLFAFPDLSAHFLHAVSRKAEELLKNEDTQQRIIVIDKECEGLRDALEEGARNFARHLTCSQLRFSASKVAGLLKGASARFGLNSQLHQGLCSGLQEAVASALEKAPEENSFKISSLSNALYEIRPAIEVSGIDAENIRKICKELNLSVWVGAISAMNQLCYQQTPEEAEKIATIFAIQDHCHDLAEAITEMRGSESISARDYDYLSCLLQRTAWIALRSWLDEQQYDNIDNFICSAVDYAVLHPVIDQMLKDIADELHNGPPEAQGALSNIHGTFKAMDEEIYPLEKMLWTTAVCRHVKPPINETPLKNILYPPLRPC